MKQLFKTTTIPLVLIVLETSEDVARFDELNDPEDILHWLDELHDDGILNHSYNVNHMTWCGDRYDDRAEFNLLYDTGEMVKLVVKNQAGGLKLDERI